MAKQGNYTAYQALRPSGDGISKDIQYWNNDGYARRKEKRDIEDAELARENQERKDKHDKYNKYFKKVGVLDKVGSRSFDKIIIDAIAKIDKGYLDVTKELSELKDGDEGYLDAIAKLKNLDNSAERLKSLVDTTKANRQFVMGEFQKGNILEDEKWNTYNNNFKEDGYVNAEIGLDDDYNFIVKWGDIDGDGVPDYQDERSILKGELFTKLNRNFDLGKEAKNLADGFSTHTKTGLVNGNEFKTNTKVEINEDDFNKNIEQSLFNKEGALTPLGRAASHQFKTNNRDEIIEGFKVLSRPHLPNTKDVTKVNSSAKTSRYNSYSKNEKDDTPEKPITSDVMEGDYGSKAFTNLNNEKYNTVDVDYKKEGKGILLEVATDVDGNIISNGYIQYLTYDNDKNLVARVSYEKNKGSLLKVEDEIEEVLGINWKDAVKTGQIDNENKPTDKLKKENPELAEKIELVLNNVRKGAENAETTVVIEGAKIKQVLSKLSKSERAALKKEKKEEEIPNMG